VTKLKNSARGNGSKSPIQFNWPSNGPDFEIQFNSVQI
jgi:hypothetical protein